jgi:hypothetical protein
LIPDLAIVAVLGVAGGSVMAAVYFDKPVGEVAGVAFYRKDRADLRDRLGKVSNLAPRHLWNVGRATTAYSVLMPVEPRNPDRSFFAPPTYVVDLEYSGEGPYPTTGLFLQPLHNLLGNALSLFALAGMVVALGWASVSCARRISVGDPFHTLIAAQAPAGWFLYSLFNPFEPFLWIVEFLPLWIAMIADHSRGRNLRYLVALGALTVLVAAHNWFAFYLPFR